MQKFHIPDLPKPLPFPQTKYHLEAPQLSALLHQCSFPISILSPGFLYVRKFLFLCTVVYKKK